MEGGHGDACLGYRRKIGILRESMFDHMFGHLHCKPCRRIKFKMTPRDQGDGKGRNAQQGSLEGRRDGSGIGDIIPQVSPFVNPRDDQPWSIGKDDIDPQMNAICRSSIHSVIILLDLFYATGPMEGKGVSDGALLPVRSNDEYIADLTESPCQYKDAFGMDAIVIGHQNLWLSVHR